MLAIALAATSQYIACAGPAFQSSPNKDVVIREEQPAAWQAAATAGYESEYMFRGVDLTPGASGLSFEDANVKAYGFALGAWFGQQLGLASADKTDALGEGGGEGGGAFSSAIPTNKSEGASIQSTPGVGERATTSESQTEKSTFNNSVEQKHFKELDMYETYSHSIGPVDVTLGNILFLIYRDALFTQIADSTTTNTITQTIRGIDSHGNFTKTTTTSSTTTKKTRVTRATVGDEQFDRVFLSLTTSKIPHLTPSLTYYQTVFNMGEDPVEARDNQKGGYLEGKLATSLSLANGMVVINPYSLISVSFGDRVHEDGRPLYGFNAVQAGLEVAIHATRWLTISPFGAFAQHLCAPPAGTHYQEYWGGIRNTVTF